MSSSEIFFLMFCKHGYHFAVKELSLLNSGSHEKQKIIQLQQVRVEIESFFDGLDFSEPLTRAHFEELDDDLFRKTVGPVKKAMEDVGLEKRQIDEIVLVGGIYQNSKSSTTP
ncbi:putative Heat shock protein 70 family [Helianthus anomalus]